MRFKHTIILSFCFHVFAFAATSLFSNSNSNNININSSSKNNDLSEEVFPQSFEVEIKDHETDISVNRSVEGTVKEIAKEKEKSISSESLISSSDLPVDDQGNQSANLAGKPSVNLIVNLSSGILHPYLLGLRQKVYFKLNSISELDVSKDFNITFLIDKLGSISDVKVENNESSATKAENNILAKTVNDNLKSAQNYKKIAAALMQIKSLGKLPEEISAIPIRVRLPINN